jgi:magnesium transporter
MRVSDRNDLLILVSSETQTALERLLPYPKDCAGAIMTTEFVAVPSDWTVEQVLAHVRTVEHARETVYAITASLICRRAGPETLRCKALA